MGRELLPMLGAGRGYRRRDDSVVLSAFVGADIEKAVAVIDVMAMLLLAWKEQTEGAFRPIGEMSTGSLGFLNPDDCLQLYGFLTARG